MESLSEGVTPLHAVRVPDALWSRLTEWAASSGVGDSEALRTLLRIGLDNTPPITPLRPATAGMRKASLPPGEWLFARVTDGPEWWDLDSILAQVPGARKIGIRATHEWRAIPADQMDAVRELFAGQPGRLRLHRSK